MSTEQHTRKNIINKALSKAGWNVNDPSQVQLEFNIAIDFPAGVSEANGSYQGHQFSDYVLLGRDAKPLAVVEAKRSSKDAALGQEQAKQYCYHLQKAKGGELPFCFYTNGLEIYFWDLENYPPRKVVGFPTREDLERLKTLRRDKKRLTDELINPKIAGRAYQIHAIRAVLEGIERKQRNFLLVMATGTGKTRTCIALVDTLMRAHHIERVLFLVDRIALREQALDAFKDYLPDEPRWPKLAEKLFAKDRRIYVATYPTMLNVIRDSDNQLSPHFFDLVVIDESHRSIYNTYGEILEYFKAISIGLTATPTDVIDHNTFKLFQCENGIPTFAYTYEEATTNQPAFLSNFQVMKIQTKFQKEGINKRTISLKDQKQMLKEGKEVTEINFEGNQLEKEVTNTGTNTLIVKEFMEECIKDNNGVLPGKTIFFCISKAHARRIEAIFNALYPQYHGELAKVMVSEDPRVYGKGGLLDQFKNNDMPRIAISVDMLDTGIDILEVVNLVFAKPVFSYTKFWQMIGRGTRLLEPSKIKPWCTEKAVFLILDCWDNFEYFKLKPKGKELKNPIPLPVRLVGIRLDKIAKALALGNNAILHKEADILRHDIQALPPQSTVILDAAPALHHIADDQYWQKLNDEKIEFLRREIKPLFRTIAQADFKAMRFRKDTLEVSLVLLNQTAWTNEEALLYETLTEGLIEQISELPLTIPIVAREEPLIKQAQQRFYWQQCSDASLDELAEKLAPLMKFREEQTQQEQVKLNLQDVLHTKESVEFGPQHEAVSINRYRQMVESLITELTTQNPILQKLKAGEAISELETARLAKLLNDQRPHITEDLLRSAYRNRKAKFIQFIRHILGLETLTSFPDTVSQAFEQFISEHSNLNTRQLNFLRLLKDFMIEREKIEKRDLIQAPFTVIHPQGIRGVFNQTEINEILALTERLAA